MSRVLTRPMFRLGGSTSGITSGLDSAKLNASKRPGYQGGNSVEDEFKRYRGLYDKYAPPQRGGMPGSVSSFLTNFGLNLMSQSPTGNIFSTAATAAKNPYATFQGARSAEESEQKRLNQAILGDVLEAQTKKDVATIESADANDYAVLAEDRLIADLLQQRSDKRKEIAGADETAIDALEDELDDLNIRIRKRVGDNPILDLISDDTFDDLYDGEEARLKKEMYPDTPSAAEILQATLDEVAKLKLSKGGRVAKQGGGAMFEEEVEVEEPISTRTEAASVQNLDYATLRSRLPQEIGDDIVQLLAQSEEALTEFANIRTQEDVDQFNSEFNVNLVLPQEV
jgi:hypothetical protein